MDNDARCVAEAFPPSEFILEEMEARGWSKETLAEKMMFTTPYVEQILANKIRLTKGACLMLGQAFDIRPEVWANLQKAWDDWKS
jgi:HTH-type transcriptional regulator/antitoxin HigA